MLTATKDISHGFLEPRERVLIDQVIAERSTKPGALQPVAQEALGQLEQAAHATRIRAHDESGDLDFAKVSCVGESFFWRSR